MDNNVNEISTYQLSLWHMPRLKQCLISMQFVIDYKMAQRTI